MKNVMIGLFMILLVLSLNAGQVDVDFNELSDMNDFDLGGYDDVEWESSDGINDSGSVAFNDDFNNWVSRFVTYTSGYQITEVNEPIVVSAYINSASQGGYGGIGFSSTMVNTGSVDKCKITDRPAIGFVFYSSAAWIFSTDNVYVEELNSSYSPDIPLSWYKVVLTIIPRDLETGEVNATYELYQAATDGTVGAIPIKTGSTNFVNSNFIHYNSTIYPYFGESWHRVPNIDNFSFTYPENVTLPVTLSSFTASFTTSELVSLQWTTESESDILGFNVYRSENDNIANALRVNSRLIEGTNTSIQQSYSFSDREIEANTRYYYWLESAEISNSNNFYGPVNVLTETNEDDVNPTIVEGLTGINNVYPNPFSPNTEIAYKVRENSNVKISIYNLKGQLVRSLVNENKASGSHVVGWDGKDMQGKYCPSGIYFAKMETGIVNSYHKLVLMK
jgi:hypothetical protein